MSGNQNLLSFDIGSIVLLFDVLGLLKDDGQNSLSMTTLLFRWEMAEGAELVLQEWNTIGST